MRMASWDHGGGFSLDASVRIEATDRPGLERLLRYCARPAFALERLREIDAEHLVFESIKSGPVGSVSLMLTPLKLIVRLAAPPPPRRHRHRYCGVLEPSAPLRAQVRLLRNSSRTNIGIFGHLTVSSWPIAVIWDVSIKRTFDTLLEISNGCFYQELFK